MSNVRPAISSGKNALRILLLAAAFGNPFAPKNAPNIRTYVPKADANFPKPKKVTNKKNGIRNF